MGDQCHCGRTGLINERLSMDSSGLEANVRHAERSDCMNVDVLLIIFSEQTDGFDRDESFGWQPSGNNSAVAQRPFFMLVQQNHNRSGRGVCGKRKIDHGVLEEVERWESVKVDVSMMEELGKARFYRH